MKLHLIRTAFIRSVDRLFKLPYLFDVAPWTLDKFLDPESGRLFEAGRLLNFHYFQQVVSLYGKKTINDNKNWRCT